MAKRPIIFVIDDDPSILALIQVYLAPLNYDIRTALTAEKGVEEMQRTVPDLILLDVMLPDANGIEVAERLRQDEVLGRIPIVMVTALTEAEQRGRALRAGADDFLSKPIDEAELRARVHSLLRAGALIKERDENRRLRRTIDSLQRKATIVGQSISIQAALQRAHHYAQTDFPVLITGESGTGKELFGAEIHRLSTRRNKPFLTLNCAAIPENLMASELFGYRKGAFTGADRDKTGLLEDAHGGTVFLDEIGELPINLQTHLLRFLQSNEIKPLGHPQVKKVDVRVVAATNKNLENAVADKAFREDLYFRLNVLPLHLPPLRERAGDIELLLDFFLEKESRLLGISPKKVSPKALNYTLNGHELRFSNSDNEPQRHSAAFGRNQMTNTPACEMMPIIMTHMQEEISWKHSCATMQSRSAASSVDLTGSSSGAFFEASLMLKE